MSTKKLEGTKFQINQKYNRRFSESFKRKKVKEIESLITGLLRSVLRG